VSTRTKACPICKKPRVEAFAPFCSSRCRDRDLARWFGEAYAVPGAPASPDDIVRGDGADNDQV
tara:strand:+ start:45 stop:236 length:192 start_codon:yes stop_codon:yes gene_type:complete